MDSPPIDHVTCRQDTKDGHRPGGFSLLEMMLVVTLILIVVSIATPVYKTCEVRTREAVLRDHLYTLRFLIDRFTLDNGRAPARLHELVEKGYPSADGLPTDPFTGSNESWQETKEDAPLSPSQIRQLTDWGLRMCTAARRTFPSKAPPTVVGDYRSQDSGFRPQKTRLVIQERSCRAERRSAKVGGANGIANRPSAVRAYVRVRGPAGYR